MSLRKILKIALMDNGCYLHRWQFIYIDAFRSFHRTINRDNGFGVLIFIDVCRAMPQRQAWAHILRTLLADIIVSFRERWSEILRYLVIGGNCDPARGHQHGWDGFDNNTIRWHFILQFN